MASKGLERLLALGLRPRLLSRPQAAHYVGLSPNAFDREVAAGTFPKACALKGIRRRLWDVRAIDAAIDRLVALQSNDREERKRRWREEQARRPSANRPWLERERREKEERSKPRVEQRNLRK